MLYGLQKNKCSLFFLPPIHLNSALMFWYVGSYRYLNRHIYFCTQRRHTLALKAIDYIYYRV